MKRDEIYVRCSELGRLELPENLKALGIDAITDVQVQIRNGLAFCGNYMPIAHQQMAQSKKKLAAAKSEAEMDMVDALVNKRHADISSFTERKLIIEMQASQKFSVKILDSEVKELEHLYNALRDTSSNLKTLKEQVSSIVSLMKSEKELASAGGGFDVSQNKLEGVKF